MSDSDEGSERGNSAEDGTPIVASTNPVAALCAAGMSCEGDPRQALALLEQAWAARRDSQDAAIGVLGALTPPEGESPPGRP